MKNTSRKDSRQKKVAARKNHRKKERQKATTKKAPERKSQKEQINIQKIRPSPSSFEILHKAAFRKKTAALHAVCSIKKIQCTQDRAEGCRMTSSCSDHAFVKSGCSRALQKCLFVRMCACMNVSVCERERVCVSVLLIAF